MSVLPRLRTAFSLAVTAFLVPAAASAATPPTLTWLTRYQGTIGNNQTTAMVLDAAGDAFVTGYSEGIGWDIATVKYDAAGNQKWVARYDGGHGDDDIPAAIALDLHGNVIVAGYTSIGGNHDYLTLKYDSLGVLQWRRTYSGAGNFGLDQVFGLGVDAAGNIYVTGDSFEPATGHDVATVKYSSSGNQLWARRWDGVIHEDDAANGLALDSDGNVYVTGLTDRAPGGAVDYDIVTLKYSPAGSLQWSDQYSGGAGNDEGIAIVVDSAHNAYAAGFTTGIGGRFDATLVKYTPSGSEAWVRTYDDPAHYFDSWKAVALSPLGKVGVTGFGSPSGSDSDYLTIQYDADGNAEWTQLYDGPVHGFDEAQSIAYDADGNAYVTGYSDGGSQGFVDYDYATLRYSPTGVNDWTVRYAGPGTGYNGIDVATNVAIGPSNSVYVSGWSTGSRSPLVDYATIRYDQPPATSVAAGGARPAAIGISVLGANPFRDATRLGFTLPAAGQVEVALWDAAGRRVQSLVNDHMSAGSHEAAVNGASLAPGLYFARLRTRGGEATTKLVRVR